MIIRQAAFDGPERMLKGALHCHTTRSDGAGTPEEVIRLHYENGYDFMALTDHRIYNRKNYADVPMTMLCGMEFDDTIREVETDGQFRCFHTVVLGTNDPENPYGQDETWESGTARDSAGFQPYLDKFHNDHQLTFYCHPEWSSTPARYFEDQKGHFAMEVWNSGCVLENHMDMNAAYWDELLGQGIKINGVAVDDGHAMYQHCKGWVMVRSENEEHAILKALEQGAFYSTTGPEIYDFYVEDDIAKIRCSEVECIEFIMDGHPTWMLQGEGMTGGEKNLGGQYFYIRVSVIDKEGRIAWTNPIWVKG